MIRTRAVVFDTNLLGGPGAPPDATLALVEELTDLGHRVLVPEPVVHEMCAHVRAALGKAVNDLEAFHALGLSADVNAVAEGAFDRLANLLEQRGARIVVPTPRQYAEAIEAQIYGHAPADRRNGVTTGVVDALVLACASHARTVGFEPLLATDDGGLSRAAGAIGIEVVRNLGELRKLFDGVEVLEPADALDAFRTVNTTAAWRGVVNELFGEQWGIQRVVGFSSALKVRGETVVHAFLHLVPPGDGEPAAIIAVAGSLGAEVGVAGTPVTTREVAYDSVHRTAGEVLEQELQFVPAFLRPAPGSPSVSVDHSLEFVELAHGVEIRGTGAVIELAESTDYSQGSAFVNGELVEWSDERPYTAASFTRGGVREQLDLSATGTVAAAMLSAVMG